MQVMGEEAMRPFHLLLTYLLRSTLYLRSLCWLSCSAIEMAKFGHSHYSTPSCPISCRGGMRFHKNVYLDTCPVSRMSESRVHNNIVSVKWWCFLPSAFPFSSTPNYATLDLDMLRVYKGPFLEPSTNRY